jgi:tRNA A-37 threonylcarbamoyl transferase component Bud32/tetratricopeptide (TPR) repeat protein
VSLTHWDRVKSLFAAALELPSSDRAPFLARETTGDAALLAEVQSLLDAHEQPGPFLDTVTHEFRAQAFAASSAANSRIGERIGAYRIVGVLGSGGMGDVFKAVRDDDQYRAEVAIKLMRADVRSSLTEQRFRTERQILAGLDHRNIARLLDGGTADHGMPYVVMELVTGEPIDRFCEAQKLSVRDRVQLFLQVCAAVSYAHQHLVVHRDLKPNNILVTADGSVKLLDFGIAKLLEADANTAIVEANATETSLRAMTLDYASPEQVSGGMVTTVSDVYSLGVVFYRLLTGQSPYGARVSDAQRMQEILSDTAPTRPSQVERTVDGDLDNILLMALRKEPQRRYGSVEQLANDLRNFLSGMPVQARGNSWRYRASKFVRRRKIEIAAGLIVAFSLLGGLFFSIREARIADRERQVAQRHFDSVRKLANTLLFELHDEMRRVPGSTKAREMLVNTSLEYLDSLYKGAGGDRALQEELAAAYDKVADIQGSEVFSSKGDYKEALESYGRAIALLEPIATAEPDNLRVKASLSKVYIAQAGLMLVISSPKEALTQARKGVALAEEYARKSPAIGTHAVLLADAYTVEGNVLFALDLPAEGNVLLDKVLVVVEDNWRANPTNEDALWLRSRGYNNTAIHADTRLSDAAASERAIAMLRIAAETDDRLLALKPGDAIYQRRQAVGNYNLARHLVHAGHNAEAVELYRLAAAPLARAAADPNDSEAQHTSALFNSGLARALFLTGHVDEARRLFERSAEVLATINKSGSTLRIEYAFGQNAVRLAEVYAHLAADPRTQAGARAGYWRQAHVLFEQGLASLNKVTSTVSIEPMDFVVLTDGIAGLARAKAALAKSGNPAAG